MINRIGDCFFLVSLGLIFSNSFNVTFSTFPYTTSSYLRVLLIITFITKRAIYPFSSWLPLAIAAPTPISALVHSRTLVTAGLYLIMRYSPFFSTFPLLIAILLVIRIFTSFYAGLNAVFEADLKKLIALSTLSHLGFIGLAFFSGFTSLAFFHLLTHALFKSLLFMTMGDIMTNLSHSQDIRYLSNGSVQTPGSCFVINVSLFNLLGLPSLSGFFSKDLVLERFHYSQASLFLLLVLFANVGFTYFYTYQLFFYSFQRLKRRRYSLIHSPQRWLHAPLLMILGFCTLIYSKIFFLALVTDVLIVPVAFSFKILPLLIRLFMLLWLFLKTKQIQFNSSSAWFFFRKIAGLSLVSLPLSSYAHSVISFRVVRSLELGLANHLINVYPSLVLSSTSKFICLLVARNALKMVYYSIPVFFILILF